MTAIIFMTSHRKFRVFNSLLRRPTFRNLSPAHVPQSVKHTLDIPEVGRVLWVPTHDDEPVAMQEARITVLEVRDDETLSAMIVLIIFSLGLVVPPVKIFARGHHPVRGGPWVCGHYSPSPLLNQASALRLPLSPLVSC